MKMKHPLPQKVDELRPDKPGELLMWPTSNSITVEHQSATLSRKFLLLTQNQGHSNNDTMTIKFWFFRTGVKIES